MKERKSCDCREKFPTEAKKLREERSWQIGTERKPL